MFEALLNTELVVNLNPMGLGPTTLLRGDTTLGYFGEMSASEFFNTAEVSAAIGYAGGTVYTVSPVWIKMIIDGVIIYIPKTPLRSGVKWDDLYNLKSVYGIKGNGKYPIGAGVLQNAQIVKGGYRFKIRLGSMGNDPMPLPSPNVSTTASYASSEWGRIVNALVTPKRTAAGWGLYDLTTILAGHVVSKTTYSANTTMVCTVEAGASLAVNGYSKSSASSTWVPFLELTTDDTWGNP